MPIRRLKALCLVLALAACGKSDLAEPPVPLGDFALGLNIVFADKVEMVPISRKATPEEWEAVMKKAVQDRFGRYEGSKLYNIGISVDGYALAPPGIPVVAAPKSVLVITANIWDDAAPEVASNEEEALPRILVVSDETDEADIVYEGDAAGIVKEIKEIIDARVRPAVARDGGDITFHSWDHQEGVVRLNMRGACAGCPSSTLTLKQGIENMLRHYVPEVTRVEPVV